LICVCIVLIMAWCLSVRVRPMRSLLLWSGGRLSRSRGLRLRSLS
jgi:hypothetical protein